MIPRTSKTWPAAALTRLTALLFLLSSTACGHHDQTQKMPAPDVNIVAAGRETVPVYSQYLGQTLGGIDVDIQPRAQGWITGIFFKEGDKVEKGSLLYTIDDQPTRALVNGYRANLAKAKTALVNMQANLNRVKPLAEMKALSASDLDAAIAAYESAVSDVKVAGAQLADAEIQLGYTRITASITGIIGLSKVDLGNYVGGPGGAAINTISAVGEVKVRFPVAEKDYLRFIEYQKKDTSYLRRLSAMPVDLLLDDGTLYPEKGKLELMNRQVDASTGSLLVQAIFPNRQGILRPGQYVKVRFRTGLLTDAVLVPQQAVNQLQEVYQVLVVNDSNRLVPRIVLPGSRIGSNWVITGGLKAGEYVALVGNAFINPALPIHPLPTEWNYDPSK
jgi:membrane fusion protein (multidrug efflux system)